MNDYRPLFEMDNDVVLHNLHLGAVEDANEACPGIEEYVYDVLNSYDDGTHFTIAENSVGEIGIIKKFEDFKDMTSLEDAHATQKLKTDIYNGLKAYVKFFAGDAAANSLAIDDLILFVPDQYGARTKSKKKTGSKSSMLVPMKRSDFEKF